MSEITNNQETKGKIVIRITEEEKMIQEKGDSAGQMTAIETIAKENDPETATTNHQEIENDLY